MLSCARLPITEEKVRRPAQGTGTLGSKMLLRGGMQLRGLWTHLHEELFLVPRGNEMSVLEGRGDTVQDLVLAQLHRRAVLITR